MPSPKTIGELAALVRALPNLNAATFHAASQDLSPQELRIFIDMIVAKARLLRAKTDGPEHRELAELIADRAGFPLALIE